MTRVRLALAALALAALAPALALAQDAVPTPDAGVAAPPGADDGQAQETTPATPMTIYVGVYPLRVGDLDLRTGTASLTYYMWTRWSGASDGTALELVNGTVESREHEYTSDDEGVHYDYHRCRARVQLALDFHSFPFDEHEIGIELEHAEEDGESVLLENDVDAVRYLHSPPVSGWLVDDPRYDVVPSEYHTSWGVPGTPSDEVSVYPRYRMRMRIHHDPSTTFFKTFLTLFISVLIAFLGFFMHPDVIDARVGVGVAGIFGAVTSHSVVASNLPEIPYMTLSDKVHFAGMAFIGLALVESCLVGWLVRNERAPLATRLDRWARWGMGPLFALVVTAFVALR